MSEEEKLATTMNAASVALKSAITDITFLRRQVSILTADNNRLRKLAESFRDNWVCTSIFAADCEDMCSCPHCLSARILNKTNASHKKSTTPPR